MTRLILMFAFVAAYSHAATSLIVCSKGTGATASATTIYGVIADGNCMTSGAPTTETSVQFPWSTAGTFSKMRVRINSNSLNGSSTVTFRKAASGSYPQTASDGNETITINSAQTGVINETTNGGTDHTDHVNAGDFVNFKFATGGSSGSAALVFFEILFTPDDSSKTVTKLGGFTAATMSSTADFYQSPAAFPSAVFNGVAETSVQLKIPTGGTWKNICVNVTTDTFTGNGTVTSRIGGSPGSQSATITGNTGTGTWQYCTTGSDTVSSGNLIDFAITPATTGANTLTVPAFVSEFITTDDTGFIVGQAGNTTTGSLLSANATYYLPLGGLVGQTIQGIYQTDMLTTMTVGSLSVYLVSNTLTTTPSANLWKSNSTASNLTVTLSGTGWIDAPANTDSYAAGDLVEFRVGPIGSGGTSAGLESWIAKVTYPSTPTTRIRHSVRGSEE